jgi:ketosteroid isomerase-like protein
MYLAPNTCSLAAQQDTARAVIEAYNAWDIDDILAYRAPDCKHRVLPASMNRAAKSNDEYRAYLSMIMPMYSNFTVRAPRPQSLR